MFGEMIRKLRTAHSLNQVQLAGKLGVSKQTVSNWENNNILPSIEMLVKTAEFFSVSADYLLELDSRRYIEVTGLTDTQLAHIQQVIRDIVGGAEYPSSPDTGTPSYCLSACCPRKGYPFTSCLPCSLPILLLHTGSLP